MTTQVGPLMANRPNLLPMIEMKESKLESRSNFATLIIMVGLFIFSIIEMVGFQPFIIGGQNNVGQMSAGGRIEAALHLIAGFLCITGGAIILDLKSIRLIPAATVAVLFWAWISLFWSISLQAATPRIIQTTIVTFSVFMAVNSLSSRRTLSILRSAFSIVIVLDFLSVLFIDGAIHQGYSGDVDGSWKGLHLHKNHAGMFAALSFLFFSTLLANKFNIHNLLMASASFIFLLGTQSKTSIFLAIFILWIWRLYIFVRERVNKLSVISLLVFSIILLPVLVTVFAGEIREFFENPKALTGRSELWQILLLYASDNPILGSGFGSFWRVGDISPITTLTSGWGAKTGQGHNGYLDALITMGFTGLVLTLLAFVVDPVVHIINAKNFRGVVFSIGFVFSTFVILHNFLESFFMVGNSISYFCLLIGVAFLRLQNIPRKMRQLPHNTESAFLGPTVPFRSTRRAIVPAVGVRSTKRIIVKSKAD